MSSTAAPTTRAAGRAARQCTGRALTLALAFVVPVALAACSSSAAAGRGSSTGSADRPSGTATITIEHFAYHPARLTVRPGAVVTVANRDQVAHTVHARDGAFATGDIGPGRTVTFTAPDVPGTYPYYCEIHQFMHGTLAVRR